MALYEHVFLARQDISQQQVDALVEQYKGIIETNGGTVGRIESWGLRALTYRINKNRKAYYSLLNITAPAAAIAELERQQRINEDVLRFMTVRVDEHEEGQSAMLARRDDRRDRDDTRFGGREDDRPRRPRRPRENEAGEGAAAE
ncbi:30S ribosomal protein S6 [Phyllobacterium sp. 21LDTY02-6]|jgi:small subunit ribosomal protein S6|uniref:30S ribosomal protein S6 n=1 Tax=unclassified Phyllobacterium TaxID=2638441 RepID=UPI00202159E1|nr:MULTISPECIES: 30S ribosomal protein S6 [unclassified Phyllobacterium]MCO4319757.1 30S ribosomal protein S6 [Phyllobacterium sp. 21LDTY02-6]MCX8280498.1 30S ribosomal protein S6 [Phyllobacterium sp. 0TCS1.6C]MCX8295053.1 30S ribosomal protein S6 [Phyllobacterium sp. 0TCS1.6A]